MYLFHRQAASIIRLVLLLMIIDILVASNSLQNALREIATLPSPLSLVQFFPEQVNNHGFHVYWFQSPHHIWCKLHLSIFYFDTY
ncbi:hypothetical protein CXB51_012674 [Gossypium anomalum]|uniref:Uncharacterized protein n=1 Tax=Gossypium anomalum TaxID=47600 RepID=A0A8J6D243_9ROSI|nr:hypothetical protein CXB51_012674 [Gossypium anomalum]